MADPKSWNPWHGCRRYSEGCKFCYMFVLDKAHHVPESSTEIVRTKMFGKPLEMTRKGWYKIPSGYTLRVNMTSDTFLEEADEWRTEMWRIIVSGPMSSSTSSPNGCRASWSACPGTGARATRTWT